MGDRKDVCITRGGVGKRWSESTKALSLRGGSQWIILITEKKKIKEHIINMYGSKRFESGDGGANLQPCP